MRVSKVGCEGSGIGSASVTEPGGLSLKPRPTWQKERPNSTELHFDHRGRAVSCEYLHMSKIINAPKFEENFGTSKDKNGRDSMFSPSQCFEGGDGKMEA